MRIIKLFYILVCTLLFIGTVSPLVTFAQAIQYKTYELDLKAEKLVDGKKFLAGDIVILKKNRTSKFIDKLDQKQSNKIATSEEDKRQIKRLLTDALADPDNEIVQPNYLYEADSWSNPGGNPANGIVPSDYDASQHWYYDKSNLPEAWSTLGCSAGGNCGGNTSVTVAVIDTGLAFEAFNDSLGLTGVNYTAFSTEYANAHLFVNSGEIAGNGLDDDCNGIVDDAHGVDMYAAGTVGFTTCASGVPLVVSNNFRKAGHPIDTYGHGSYVTGLIAGQVDDGGSVSPAFNITLMPIAASQHFTKSFYSIDLYNALEYARLYGASIVNMSLGGSSSDSLIQSKVDELDSAGILVIAAAGNTGTVGVQYPAAQSNVIAVGSVNSNDTRSSYSSYGPELDVVAYVGAGATTGSAPWQTTLSCYPSCTTGNINTGITQKYSVGTSFATPQVTALAALVKSYKGYNSYTLAQVLRGSSKDIDAAGFDIYTGNGVIDFNAALNYVPGQLKPVYRFWSPIFKSHFYTMSEDEKTNLSHDSNWTYERISFYTYEQRQPNTEEVYRFWSPKFVSHFYTMSEDEKTNLSHDSNWTYERISYYTHEFQEPTTIPLYRFWSNTFQSHFYTTSVDEKNNLSHDPNWTYERIAYYVK
jgi:hypothetical protein